MDDLVKRIVQTLLAGVVKSDHRGSLEKLRQVFAETDFGENKKLAAKLVGQAHLACFNLKEEAGWFAADYLARAEEWSLLSELSRIAKLYQETELVQRIERLRLGLKMESRQVFSSPPVYSDGGVDASFRKYCRENGVQIIRMLQAGKSSVRRCSYVYEVIDNDGVVKVFKQLLDYKRGPFAGSFNNEDDVYEYLPRVDFLPCYCGKTEIAPGIWFIKQSFHFGQTLTDCLRQGSRLSVDEVCHIVRLIAEKLNWLHERGVLYLDLKPENILWNGEEIKFLDLGISRVLKSEETEVDIYPAEPKYATPEGGTRLRASKASEVFQLGVLFHELLVGEHPFAIENKLSEVDDCRESAFLKYLWPTVVLEYGYDLAEKHGDARLAVVNGMLSKSVDERPNLQSVVNNLTADLVAVKPVLRAATRDKKHNTVLFPARMGIPHKGHIEYIARLLELGYYVKISLQRSYTITERDPIPKWLVMKIVAGALFERGFSSADFEFMLTPFYETDEQYRAHFAMMPGAEDVVAVASGNSGVRRMFQNTPIVDQKMVFGKEGEEYDDLSWGGIIRRAARENDFQTFNDYAPRGLEKILSFAELRSIYGQPAIEFVAAGRVRAVLLGEAEIELAAGRVFRYDTPEESLIRHLRSGGNEAEMVNSYSAETEMKINGRVVKIKYDRIEFADGDETIYFKIK